jgi:hypothetical protein
MLMLETETDSYSAPRSQCRQIALSIVQELPANLLDKGTLATVRTLFSFSVWLIGDPDVPSRDGLVERGAEDGVSDAPRGGEEVHGGRRRRGCSGLGGLVLGGHAERVA